MINTDQHLLKSFGECLQRASDITPGRRPSVVCPSSVSLLPQDLLDRFLSNFSCCLNFVIRSDLFSLIFEKKKKTRFPIFRIFFPFLLTWDPMGGKMLMLLLPQVAFAFFQTFPKFSSH